MAFALDTIAACLQTPEVETVIVVSRERDFADLPPEVRWVPDPGRGLNPALTAAAAEVDGPVMAVVSDLPCITGLDLSEVISQAHDHSRAFVSDAAGIGSTILCAIDTELRPMFEGRSRAKHRKSGATELHSPRLHRCHRDVDNLVDLADAVRIGVGSNTEVLLPTLAEVV